MRDHINDPMPAELAAGMCADPQFQEYAAKQCGFPQGRLSEKSAGEYICRTCHIKFCDDLDRNLCAQDWFDRLRAEFGSWQAKQQSI